MDLLKVLFPDRPFFEGNTFGFQGAPQRHLVMAAAVQCAAPIDRPIRILEIGSWIGSSALTFSQAIARYAPLKGSILCIDAWRDYMADVDVAKGKVYSAMEYMARNDIAYNLFLHNISFASKGVEVRHFRGFSHEVLPCLAQNYFDLIYIDGSHYYENVLNDIKMSHDLLRDGGIMCGDDLELQAHECDIAVARNNTNVDYIEDTLTKKNYHPGVTLAVDEYFGRVSCQHGCWFMKKAADGYSQIDLRGFSTFIPEHFNNRIKEFCKQFLARTK